ncbi:MAG: hypothetical protein ABI325_01905 [Ginsengibacter sp.]
MNPSFEDIVPENKKGKPSDIEHSVTVASREKAIDVFKTAAQRMLYINDWQRIGSFISAVFDLTNPEGQKLERPAALGDFIRIDIQGPGSSEGDGYDWVFIEAMDDKSNSDAEEESLAMRVRPCKQPGKETNAVAHFFTGEATSTFIIRRDQNTVTSSYHGRNEILNTGTGKPLDKVRNVIMGGAALAGISEIQWDVLIRSFLKQEV